MCSITAALTIASAGASMAGAAMENKAKRDAARKNNKMVRDQQLAEMSTKQREFIIQNNAAVKEGGKAAKERDRSASTVKAMGEGMTGNTAPLRIADQMGQGSINISAAQDRATAADFNYTSGVEIDRQEAANKIDINTPSKGAAFANIITAGLSAI